MPERVEKSNIEFFFESIDINFARLTNIEELRKKFNRGRFLSLYVTKNKGILISDKPHEQIRVEENLTYDDIIIAGDVDSKRTIYYTTDLNIAFQVFGLTLSAEKTGKIKLLILNKVMDFLKEKDII